MKYFLLVMCVFVVTDVLSQEMYLKITNPGSDKVSEFKENQRVRVKTVQGGKISGKMKIMENDQIMVQNIILPIKNIAKIKAHPVFLNVIFSGILFLAGGYAMLAGLAYAIWGAVGSGIASGVISGALIFAGIKSPNILPAVLVNGNSTIQILNVLE